MAGSQGYGGDQGYARPGYGGATTPGGSGDVVGPGSSFDNAVARYDGTTGKLIQGTGQVILGDTGTVTRYPPGVTSATAATDAAYAAILPDGTAADYEVLKSWRPESLPDYGRRLTVANNPVGTVPDVVHSQGWNVGRVISLPMIWRATESWYNPNGVRRFEDHVVEGGWPAGSYWKSNTPRRAISVEVAEAPVGTGGCVNIGCDADVFYLQSVERRTVAEGGLGGPRGEFFRVSQSVSDADTRVVLTSVATAANALTIQLHPTGGYCLFETSRLNGDIYFRPTGAGAVYLGASGGAVRLQGNVGFFGGAAAAKPTVTGSRGGNAALQSLLSALAGLSLLTDSTTA